MKMFCGYLFAFGMMTAVCFAGISGIVLFFHLIAAFVVWDLAPIMFEWSSMLAAARFILAISALIGVWFACSKEGRDVAEDVANG